MKNKFTNIVVNLQVEGLHAWPGVKDTQYVDKVGYLQYPHRHLFHIKCIKSVNHGDRDIEIIDFKHQINQYLLKRYASTINDKVCRFGNQSCEMIAEELLEKFQLESCEVLEDGENGAQVVRFHKIDKSSPKSDKLDDEARQLLTKEIENVELQHISAEQIMQHETVFGQSTQKDQSNLTFICSYLQGGKTHIAQSINATPTGHRIHHIEVSDIVKQVLQTKDRAKLQGHPELDSVIVKRIEEACKNYINVVVSGVRQPSILQAFPNATMIWINTPRYIRFKRYQQSSKDTDKSWEGFVNANGRDIELGINQVKEYIFQWNCELSC